MLVDMFLFTFTTPEPADTGRKVGHPEVEVRKQRPVFTESLPPESKPLTQRLVLAESRTPKTDPSGSTYRATVLFGEWRQSARGPNFGVVRLFDSRHRHPELAGTHSLDASEARTVRRHSGARASWDGGGLLSIHAAGLEIGGPLRQRPRNAMELAGGLRRAHAARPCMERDVAGGVGLHLRASRRRGGRGHEH